MFDSYNNIFSFFGHVYVALSCPTLVNYATPYFILLLYFLRYFIVWYINK